LYKILCMLSFLNSFRVVALLEGVSFILLLFIATPIKKWAHNPMFVELLGMPHGILFLVYIVLAIMVGKKLKWNTKTLVIVLVASLIPFGTFYIDNKYLKNRTS
jgi:integral membrane protein